MQNEIPLPQKTNENDSHPEQPRQPGVARVPSSRKAKPATGRAENDLALFSLIADPQTIAGGPSSDAKAEGTANAAEQELERLRLALHAREQELESLRLKAEQEAPLEDTKAPVPELQAESPRPKPSSKALLDADSAQRLAREAKQRENASRLALQNAQQAFRADPGTQSDSIEQGWETRPLSVQRHALEKELASSATPSDRPKGAPRPEGDPRIGRGDFQLRAARAEVRELEATLAIARDTTINQKLEIARLRSELEAAPAATAAHEMAALEEAFKSVLPEEESIDVEAIRIEAQNEIRAQLADENNALEAELKRLQERVSIGEQEMEAREAERRVLRETLDAREDDINALNAEVNEFRQRFDGVNAERERLRVDLEEERSHNAATQSVLEDLRKTLGIHNFENDDQPPPATQEQPATALRGENLSNSIAFPEYPDSKLDSFAESSPLPASRPTAQSPSLVKSEAQEFDEARTQGGANALFGAWQDDQVRRHFGPFGLDTTRDLVVAPLERRRGTTHGPAKVLILGEEAEEWAEHLAEDLIAFESPPFELVVGSTLSPQRDLHDRPIHDFLTAVPAPASPAELTALLSEVQPSVIITRGFFSKIEAVGEWIAALRTLPEMGPALIFMESTGIGPVLPPEEMSSMGDRIWSLMPARYTRAGSNGGRAETRIESWQEAFAAMTPPAANGLRTELRKHFEFEIAAQFGFLTEPFLRSPIADNFDPAAQRDRRFLHQIADLDDRKIESGIAPALHFVARIDGRAEG